MRNKGFTQSAPFKRQSIIAPKLRSDFFDNATVASVKTIVDTKGISLWKKDVQMFLEVAPNYIEKIRDAITGYNGEMLRKAAYSLKAVSANLGAKKLASICLAVETAEREHDFSHLDTLLLALENRYQELVTILQYELHSIQNVDDVKTELKKKQQDSIPADIIMVVDDDQQFRKITVAALQSQGFKVIEAHSGNDALNKLKYQKKIDLIILDAKMDDMNGFETCEVLRSDSETSEIPIIMSTGLNDVESINRAYKAGASDFMVKPVNFKLLVLHIRFLIRASKEQSELRKNKIQLSQAQRIARLGFWTWYAEHNTIEISPYLAEILKIFPHENNLTGTLESLICRVHPEDRSIVENAIYATLEKKENSFLKFRLVNDQGSFTQVHQETALIAHNVVTGTVQDVTRQKESELLMYQLAYNDKLTGLLNRAYYQKHISSIVNTAKRHNKLLALLFLDLDEFKNINDSFGHDVGDQFLQVIAQRIKAATRDVDLAVRMGGDEFCILLDDIVDEDQAITVAERCLFEINQPTLLAGTQIKPRVSVGIALFPKDADNENDLMKAADAAMYSAKTAGKQRFARYSPEMTSNAVTRLIEEQRFLEAIEKHQFVLHYQPQINLLTGKVHGIEALLRWQHPTKGLVGPQDFIGLAESIGLINKLEDWVLHTACQHMMAWHEEGMPLVTLAVNISSFHLRDRRLLDTLKSTLTISKLPPEYLEIEVTESAIQLENDVSIFAEIKQLGLKVAVNNFGSSYTSLASLNHIPLDCLKIDRRIVKDSSYNKNIPLMLNALINIANTNGYKLIAEGVETIDQILMISGLGCQIFQGYFFDQPVPSDQIPALFAKNYSLNHAAFNRRAKDNPV